MEDNKQLEIWKKISDIVISGDLGRVSELEDIDETVPYYLQNFNQGIELGLFDDNNGIVTHIQVKGSDKEEFGINVSQLKSIMEKLVEFEELYSKPVLIYWCAK